MVYAAFGEPFVAALGFRALEGGGLCLVGFVHGDRCGDDISDPFLKPPLYRLELAYYTIQYSAGIGLALAALLGITIRGDYSCLVPRDVRRVLLGTCARRLATYRPSLSLLCRLCEAAFCLSENH